MISIIDSILDHIDEYQNPYAKDVSRFIMQNPILLGALLISLILILIGCHISLYKYNPKKSHSYSVISINYIKSGNSFKYLNSLLDRLFSIKPAFFIKNAIKENLKLYYVADESGLNRMSNIISTLIIISSVMLVIIFKGVGQLWYSRALIIVLCAILPYYVADLVFDVLRHRMNRHIPKLIDEFRIAFNEKKRIKPALHESSKHTHRKLGCIVERLADSTFVEDGLIKLKDSFNNLWFNTFTTLICNYKSNGGDLGTQLYKLNRSMTRYISMQKKKDLRLIWYEVFTLCAALLSIPAVSFLNGILLGSQKGMAVDTVSNIIMARVAAYCIFALITVRLLRKL